MAKIPVLDSKASYADVAATLGGAGCVVVKNVIDEPVREALKHELAPSIDEADAGQSLNKKYAEQGGPSDFYPGSTKRITALIAKSKTFHGLANHPMMRAVCDALLLPNCVSYQLHATAGLVVGPGATVQVLHREEDPFAIFRLPRPNLIVASMWAITDFTERNGGTHLVPGSHRWPADRKASEGEVCAAEMPAGSVLLWMGGTLHGAGANRSDNEWRYGIFASYSCAWLRQEENMYLDVPREVARDLPKEIRDLVGYKMHMALGYAERPR
jgi:ectoine hydroxylase-related dioxygenase (phytanoyl-CoA dioxygenase family)